MTMSPAGRYRRAVWLTAILLAMWLGSAPPLKAQAPGSLDGSFVPVSASGGVMSIALQADGKILLGGYFTSVNGVARNRIARLNADGSLDQGFNPGSGADEIVLAVALQRDGKVIIGGTFQSFDGVVRNQIARLNPDGSLDMAFAPSFSSSSSSSSSFQAETVALAVQSDDKILVSQASIFNGEAHYYLVRLNLDGTLDADFAPILDSSPFAIALQSDGKIVIGGDFRTVNGVSHRNGVARLNIDGSLDPAFDRGGDGIYTPTIRSVAVQGDGKILIGGYFNSINGVNRRSIARLKADGSLDMGFDAGASWANVLIFAIAAQTDHKAVIGGALLSASAGPNDFARLNADGTPDTDFDPGIGPVGSRFGDQARDIVIQCDGRILIGGNFREVNGVPRVSIARLHGEVPACGPDLAIRNVDETFSVGDNIYNLTGTDQAKTQLVSPGRTATYVVTVQYDGTAPEPLTLTGPAGSTGWTVRYFDAPTGGSDMTTAVTGSGWTIGLGPGATREIRVELTAAATLAAGQQQTVLLTATAAGGGARQDAVAATATVTVVVRRPDLLIRNSYETSVAGNDVYNTTGENQSQAQAVLPGLSAAFVVSVQNAAAAADAFTLTGPAGSAGWAINYFDSATGGNDITAEVTGGGWTTGSLGAGAAQEMRVELTPAVSLPGGQQIDVRVTAASTGDPAMRDTVLASARTPLPLRPDLLIRLGSEADALFAGGNIYGVTGQNQTKIQEVVPGATAVYVIALENDSDRPDQFRLTGIGSRLGWTFRYFDAASGGTDITGPVTTSGWMSPVLAPGGSVQLRFEVVAGSTVAPGSQASLRVLAASAGDPARQDVVVATTRRSPRGNTLISDTANYRVIEVDAAKTIVWQYGTGVPGTGPNQLQGPARARRLTGGNTLIVDHDGNRVIEVTPDRAIVWQFDKSDIAGGANRWSRPVYAERLADGNTLITAMSDVEFSYLAFGDQTVFHRLIEVAPDKSIVWRYDTLTGARSGTQYILPTSAVRLAQGMTLFAEGQHGLVLEVARNKKTIWSYGGLTQLKHTRAVRLSNGNTLISDLYRFRVIEVGPAKTIVWQYGRTDVSGYGPNQLIWPSSAVRLANGNTLIAHGADRVIEVNRSKTIVWQYGGDVTGSGPNQLHGPSDAQRLGPQ